MELAQYSDLWLYQIIPNCPLEFLSVCKQWRDAAFMLLKNEPRLTRKRVHRAIKFAALTNHVKLLKGMLLHPLANVTCGGQYPIRAAAALNNLQAVRILLEQPNVNPGYFQWAYGKGRTRPKWKLQFGQSAIDAAAKEGYIEVVQCILAKFPQHADAALKKAVECGKETLVGHLLDNLEAYGINLRSHDFLRLALPFPLIFEALYACPVIAVNGAFYSCIRDKDRRELAKRLLYDERLNLRTMAEADQSNIFMTMAAQHDTPALERALSVSSAQPTYNHIDASTKELDYDTTKMLLERVALNAASYTQRLTNCVSTSDLMTANRLLELVLSKGNVNDRDAGYALEEAAKHNNVVACELLLKHASPANNEYKAVKNALAHKAERAAVVLLRDPRVTPSYSNNYFIRYASEKGLADVVEALLKLDKVDPAVEQNAALRSACVTGSLGVVKLLLADPRVNPAAFTNHAIQVASLSGHIDIVKLLLADSRVNPSANANYAFVAAKQRGHKEIMALLEADPRFKKL